MSIPTSKILKASKSIMAIAELRNHSPMSSQSQNVNVIIGTQPPAQEEKPDQKAKYPDAQTQPAQAENPYHSLPPEQAQAVARDIESAMEKTKEIESEIEEKENTIRALTLIIECLQGNPLIVNKFVVAEMAVLSELIRLLTSADSVEIDCADVECSCMAAKYRTIKRIYVRKDGEVYSISQCPVILRLLDNYRISLNFVI